MVSIHDGFTLGMVVVADTGTTGTILQTCMSLLLVVIAAPPFHGSIPTGRSSMVRSRRTHRITCLTNPKLLPPRCEPRCVYFFFFFFFFAWAGHTTRAFGVRHMVPTLLRQHERDAVRRHGWHQQLIQRQAHHAPTNRPGRIQLDRDTTLTPHKNGGRRNQPSTKYNWPGTHHPYSRGGAHPLEQGTLLDPSHYLVERFQIKKRPRWYPSNHQHSITRPQHEPNQH